MSREECEARLCELMEEMFDVYRQYEPNGDWLHAYISNENIWIFNENDKGLKELDAWRKRT